MSKGLFISFEGGEGAGKTTLINLLYEKLTDLNYQVINTFEPGGTQISDKIRDILLFSDNISPYCELGLFLASRAEHVAKVIKPAIDEGKIVLCDRFSDSTIAYQGVARGLGKKKIQELCQTFSDSLNPDLTFYLDIDPMLGLQRQKGIEKDRIESEKIDFHKTVRKAFLELADENQNRIHILNASDQKQIVFDAALNKILSHLS